MRKLSIVVIVASLGATLLACTDQPRSGVNSSATNSLAYERPAPIVRAPLAPAQGYASPPPLGTPPPLGAPYGNPPAPAPLYGSAPQYGADPQTAALDGWRASPRWSAVQGDGCIEVEQAAQPGPGGRMKIEPCAGQALRDPVDAPGQAMVPPETMAPPEAMAPGETMAPPDY